MLVSRAQLKKTAIDQRLEALRNAGFTVTPSAGGRVTVGRDGCAVVLDNASSGAPRIIAERIVMAGGIGKLASEGFWEFFLAGNGSQKPALAQELKAPHGLERLYNESFSKVSAKYVSDRVKDRDHGVPKRRWE